MMMRETRETGIALVYWNLNYVIDPMGAQMLPAEDESQFSHDEAEQVYGQLVAIYTESEARTRAAQRKLCPQDTGLPGGKDAYAAIDAYIAREDAAQLAAYREVFSRLDPATAERIENWLLDAKPGFVGVKYDTELVFEITNEDIGGHMVVEWAPSFRTRGSRWGDGVGA
jgi:hypothetical protein